jgi:hypothetical protein
MFGWNRFVKVTKIFVVAVGPSIGICGQTFASDKVEWLGPSAALPYQIDLEAPATHCELVVDEFAISEQSKYGTSSAGYFVALRTRPGDHVLNAGYKARVYESSSKRNEDGTSVVFEGERLIGEGDDVLLTQPERFDGRSAVSLAFEWNSYGNSMGSRRVDALSFFVDLRTGEGVKRLWLLNEGNPFSSRDFARESNNYSYPVFWGYGTNSYLWRDGGSPVFAARQNCVQ